MGMGSMSMCVMGKGSLRPYSDRWVEPRQQGLNKVAKAGCKPAVRGRW